jgi:ribosomal RNA-processing protein 9
MQGLVFRDASTALYSCSKDRTVKTWSVDDRVYIETMYGHQAAITGIDAIAREVCFVFSPR